MGGKRKPDPEIMRQTFHVPRDRLHIFKHMAKSQFDHAHGRGAFEKLTKQEKNQALSDYFSEIALKDAKDTLGSGVWYWINSYRLRQKRLEDKITSKLGEPKDP